MVEKKKTSQSSSKKRAKMPAKRRSSTPPVRKTATLKKSSKTVNPTKKKATPKKVAVSRNPPRCAKRKSPVKRRESPPTSPRRRSSRRTVEKPPPISPKRSPPKRNSPRRIIEQSPPMSPKRSPPKRNINVKQLEIEFESLMPNKLTKKNILNNFHLDSSGNLDIGNWKNHELLQAYKPLQNFKDIANQEFTIPLYKKFRRIIDNKDNRHYLAIEELWVDFYLQPVIDFMAGQPVYDKSDKMKKYPGQSVWYDIFGVMPYERHEPLPHSNTENAARFQGRHWFSKKAGDYKEFDPYSEYQFLGSNQFCQTYSLMYALNKLPNKEDNKFQKFYTYSKKALEFMLYYYLPNIKGTKFEDDLYIGQYENGEEIYDTYNQIKMRIQELLDNYSMTLNCITLNFELSNY